MAAGKITRRPRAERRAEEREAEKRASDRARLARLEPGGHPDRPIVLASASQVEPHALGLACTRCGGAARVDDHAAVVVNGSRLRSVRLACLRCGTARQVWFRLAAPLLN